MKDILSLKDLIVVELKKRREKGRKVVDGDREGLRERGSGDKLRRAAERNIH